jgi:uncharacterized protein (DUF2062 family)
MAKKFFKQWMDELKHIRDHEHLKVFGNFIHDPNLWHLNRYSVSTAFSVGLFAAFMPMPFQMVLAGALAIFFKANLPISVALVWLTNPITMPPLFYLSYKVGAWVLRMPFQANIQYELSLHWIAETFHSIGAPFLLGCIILGLVSGTLCNILIRLYWRIVIMKEWHSRKEKRRKNTS